MRPVEQEGMTETGKREPAMLLLMAGSMARTVRVAWSS
jgi:hypothetical protein